MEYKYIICLYLLQNKKSILKEVRRDEEEGRLQRKKVCVVYLTLHRRWAFKFLLNSYAGGYLNTVNS
jgi:hypothetical protein